MRATLLPLRSETRIGVHPTVERKDWADNNGIRKQVGTTIIFLRINAIEAILEVRLILLNSMVDVLNELK